MGLEIVLAVPYGAPKIHLESLHAWLSGDPELGKSVRWTHTESTSGSMGPGLDAVAIALGSSGGALTVLAQSVKAWVEQVRAQRGADVRVETCAPDGTRTIVDAHNVQDVEKVLRRAMRGGSPPRELIRCCAFPDETSPGLSSSGQISTTIIRLSQR